MQKFSIELSCTAELEYYENVVDFFVYFAENEHKIRTLKDVNIFSMIDANSIFTICDLLMAILNSFHYSALEYKLV